MLGSFWVEHRGQRGTEDAEAICRMMQLRDIIARYKELSGGSFGRAVALRAFGWAAEETEQAFGQFDEDYHISRYFHFSDQRGSARDAAYSINGFPQTHVALDKEIEEIL